MMKMIRSKFIKNNNKNIIKDSLEEFLKISNIKLYFMEQFQLGTFEFLMPQKNYSDLLRNEALIPALDIDIVNKIKAMGIEIDDRLRYDILEHYYVPMNQAIDRFFLEEELIQKKFKKLISSIDESVSYDAGTKDELIDLHKKSFNFITKDIKFSATEEMNNLYYLANYLSENQKIDVSVIQSHNYQDEEKLDETQEKTMCFVKETIAAIHLNVLLSSVYLNEFKVGLDAELDITFQNQILSNRLSLLLREINSKKDLFIEKNSMNLVKKCLNNIIYTEDSILELQMLGNEFLFSARLFIEENHDLEFEQIINKLNELHDEFQNIYQNHSKGIQKLGEFNLLNSGIKLSSKIDLNKRFLEKLDLVTLYNALQHNTHNIEELLFRSDMEIKDDFLFALAENKTLKLLSFKECEIQNIEILIDTLKENKKIKSLNFSKSNLTNEHIIEIANILEKNVTIQELNLSGNMLEVEQVTNESIVELANILKSNKNLLKLDISHMSYDDEGAIAIAEALKVNTTLKEINLSHTYAITDEGVIVIAEALMVNKTLERINLQESRITDRGATVIAEALKVNKTLKEINLSANSDITDEGVIAIAEALTVNKTLERIDLLNSTITEYGTTKFIEHLEYNSSLQEFGFLSRSIEIESFIKVARALKENNALNSIYLFVNDNGDTAAHEIAEMLCTNIKLQKLNLYLKDITDEGAIIIAEALKVNKTLKEINLSNSQFTDEAAIIIAEALKVNQSLEILDLSGSQFTNEGAIAIAESLAENTTLKEINLSSNNIENEGAIAITEALKLNGILKKVVLENNNITDEDTMINLLKENNVLVECNIPIEKNKAMLIDIINRKFSATKDEIDTIKFYGISDDDLVNRHKKLIQLKSFKDLLFDSEEILDSYREKFLESIFFFKPNLVDRCELLHKLFAVEKDSIKYIQDDFILKSLYQVMHQDFDKIIFNILDNQLLDKEENIYSILPSNESIGKLLKILQYKNDFSLKSATDKYSAIIECDPDVQFNIGELMESALLMLTEKEKDRGIDDEKISSNDRIKDYYLKDEVHLGELLCLELELLGNEHF